MDNWGFELGGWIVKAIYYGVMIIAFGAISLLVVMETLSLLAWLR